MINHISFPNLGMEFSINRVAFSVFGIEVYWYGIIIAGGLILALIYAAHESRTVGLNQDHLLNMFLIAVPIAIVCARLYYVIFSWDDFKDDLLHIFDIRGGGIAIYGAVIGAALVVLLYCRWKKVKVGVVLDIMAVGFLIGQAIGRWGNFVNGEAFGTVTALPWAMTIQRGSVEVAHFVHPTYLYESLWNAVGVGALLLYKRFRKFDGEIFLGYIVWYGLGRSWIEGLRTDSLFWGPVRVSQILAILCVAGGIAAILIGRIRSKRQLS